MYTQILEALRAKGQRGVLTKTDYFDHKDERELLVREYNETIDRPVRFKNDSLRVRAKCKRRVFVFTCTARYGVYLVS